MRLISASAVALVAVVSVGASASAAPPVTPGKPVAAPQVVRDVLEIKGVGCGVPASSSLALPPNVFGVQVQRPKVGAKDVQAHITKVVSTPNAVTFTAVADSDAICDPDRDPTPPASRRWSAEFEVEVAMKRRVVVAARADWLPRGGYLVHPRVVGLSSGAGLAQTDTVRDVRWNSFGGRKAVGFGVFKARRFFCPSPSRCIPQHNQPVRVELTLPTYCTGTNVVTSRGARDFVFYGKVAAFNLRRIVSLRPGTEIQSYTPDCAPPSKPVRLR
jgi:hypothetical protein